MNLSRQTETENEEVTMRHRNSSRLSSTAAVTALLGGLWVWPAISSAQLLPPLPVPPVGTLFGTTPVLADTGTLVAGTSDVLQASDTAGGIASALPGAVLHAGTIGCPGQVDSEAPRDGVTLNLART